jgi:hypothetical protein
MIISSIRARVAKDIPGALQWSQAIASFIQKKTGNEVEAFARAGATQDIVWLQRFPDLAAYQKTMESVQSDPEYWQHIKEAESKGYFDVANVEAGIWRKI